MYQRMIQACLEKHIGKTAEAYVDDVVVKTKDVRQLVKDLGDIFTSLQVYDINLNLEKCFFGVPTGKLFVFIISHRGIVANPAKIWALATLAVPTELKHVQKLPGRVAALTRFISWLGEKALPLYKLLKQTKNFKWASKAYDALEATKNSSILILY